MVNAQAASAYRPLLDAINSGTPPQGAPQGRSGGGSTVSQPIVIHNYGTSQVTSEQMNDHIRFVVRDQTHQIVQQQTPGMVAKHAPDVIATDISNPNSKTSKALSRNVTTSRVR